MRGVNKVILVGTLGQDPEVRYLPNGNAVCSLSLATNESWTDKQTGQKVEKTEWHRVVLFGKVAEIAGQYCAKGSQLYIEGKLQTREWERDGIKRYTTEILVDMQGTLQLLGGGGGQQRDQQYQQYDTQQQQRQPQQNPRQQSRPQSNHSQSDHRPQQQGNGQQTRPQQQRPQPQQQAPQPQKDFDSFDDDIPFNEAA